MTAPAAPVFGVFGTTVDAVYRLIPEADRVTDPNNSALSTPITELTVQAWIVEVSAMLSGSIGDWAVLTGTAAARVTGAAQAAVANGVASYVEAARYPTLAGLNDSSYSGVLWARYLAMGSSLAVAVQAEISEGGIDVINPVIAGPFSAGMPDPYFVDGEYWSPWADTIDPRAQW